jgi:hypothetical protein
MDKTKPITVVSMAEKRRLEAAGFTNVNCNTYFCTECGKRGPWKVEHHFGVAKAFCSEYCKQSFTKREYKS